MQSYDKEDGDGRRRRTGAATTAWWCGGGDDMGERRTAAGEGLRALTVCRRSTLDVFIAEE